MAYNPDQVIVVLFWFLDFGLSGLGFFIVVEGCLVEIEFLGERVLCCDFLVYKGVQIEDDALEMDDQDFGWSADPGFLGYIHLVLAKIAGVLRNHLSMAETIEGFSQSLRSFDF